MQTRLIVNRITDWFDAIDFNNDPYYVSIKILEKLNTRKKVGLTYNEIFIKQFVLNRTNTGASKTLNNAISILLSRGLIDIVEVNEITAKVFITPLGSSIIDWYKKDVKNENR